MMKFVAVLCLFVALFSGIEARTVEESSRIDERASTSTCWNWHPLSQTNGRCGPEYGGRCNKELEDYAVYCNTVNGWCGTSDDHKDAQVGDEYDWEPQLCIECRTNNHCDEGLVCNTDDGTCGCQPLSETVGRCGPEYGGRCNKGLADYAVYCNTANGWCGTTDEHKNAQASDEYDWEPQLCQV